MKRLFQNNPQCLYLTLDFNGTEPSVSCHHRADILMAFKMMGIVTARKRSLGQGNMFTPVCHSVHRGGVRGCSRGGRVWLIRGACVAAPGGGRAWDTTRYGDAVNERAVRILLECILLF